MSFERACALAEVPLDEALGVTIGRYDVAVARHEDEIFAVQDLCSHAAVALSEGEVADCTVECWLHGPDDAIPEAKARAVRLEQRLPVRNVLVVGPFRECQLSGHEEVTGRAVEGANVDLHPPIMACGVLYHPAECSPSPTRTSAGTGRRT